jgi:hypothetical protein
MFLDELVLLISLHLLLEVVLLSKVGDVRKSSVVAPKSAEKKTSIKSAEKLGSRLSIGGGDKVVQVNLALQRSDQRL